MGFVSFTVIVKVVGDARSGDAEGVKPEKKPPAEGRHGSWNDDWTTE